MQALALKDVVRVGERGFLALYVTSPIQALTQRLEHINTRTNRSQRSASFQVEVVVVNVQANAGHPRVTDAVALYIRCEVQNESYETIIFFQ